jgi:signal transduction histidine kinase
MAGLPEKTGEDRVFGDRVSGEQAALRRVATLVAEAASPEEVFAAVTEEAGRLLRASYATMARYDPGGVRTVVAAWGSAGPTFSVGAEGRLGGQNVATLVSQTGRAARIDDPDEPSGPIGEAVRHLGIRAAVGVPVIVEGRLWGAMAVGSQAGPLPAGTEARLSGFTELAATAIANAQTRMELRGFAEEQAALRRVATLVARAAPPPEVLDAVTREAGQLLRADYATMNRFAPDGAITVAASWSDSGAAFPVGSSARLGGRNIHTTMFQTCRSARIDNYASASGPIARTVRELGLRAAVGVPVSVDDRLWGIMIVGSRAEPLPVGTEARLAGFTELAATAIANAEARAALTTSRARIVATADATRRRFERDLHDGAQQRLVSLTLELRAVQAAVPPASAGLIRQHPAILAEGGLRPALRTLARRSALPVHLDIEIEGRLPEPIEIAAYYTVSEALTNAVKHADAAAAEVAVTASDGLLHVRVCDNGHGGADFIHGSGLVGLKDRAEALGGHLQLRSLPGAGTTLETTLPLDDRSASYPS